MRKVRQLFYDTGAAYRQFSARRLARRGSYGLVLMYHRIADTYPDPWDLAVSPANFAAQLEVIKRLGATSTFGDLAKDGLVSSTQARTFAVTMDDGYRDNLTNALPLLEAADVPATVFVTTGTIGTGREFWWDALARIFLGDLPLPERLRIGFASGNLDLSIAPAGPKGLAARRTALMKVWQKLRLLPAEGIEEHLQELADWAGVSRAGATSDHPMDEGELRRFAASPLIEIGGHTVSHPVLPMLGIEDALREIRQGRDALRDWTGQEITSFAYPFGAHDSLSVRFVLEAGFSQACTVMPGVTTSRTDRFRVPRLQVKNWTGEQFEKAIYSYVGR